MPNGIIEIEEFEKVNDDSIKLNIVFKTLVSTIYTIDKRFEAGNVRFEKLENRKLKDKIYAAGGGIIGGALAFIGFKAGGIQ